MLYSYLSIVFCGVSIYRILKKEVSKYTINTIKYQNQVSLILAIEAIAPVITVVIPTGTDGVASYLNLYTPWLGPVRKTITCIAPLLNPIIKMCVISCYRNIVLKYMGRTTEDSLTSKVTTSVRNTIRVPASVNFLRRNFASNEGMTDK